MSADPPPPPQLSPDGKFWWDGRAWQPMQAAGWTGYTPLVAPQLHQPSPDGRYYWDGERWVPTHTATTSEP